MGQFGCHSCGENLAFTRHIAHFTNEVVTIFTTSGGASGCGFTGFLISVNCNFVRLVTDMGEPPANPLSTNICGGYDNGVPSKGLSDLGDMTSGRRKNRGNRVGSVCDIPIDKIAAFCHNTV